MDFEEHLWASKVPQSIIDRIKKCYECGASMEAEIHLMMLEKFREFSIVGGMPGAV